MIKNDHSTRRQFLIQSSAVALGGVTIPSLISESRASGAVVPDERSLRKESVAFDRYTDRARKVVQLAYQEARRAGFTSVGTEHILLGLIREGSGVAAHALRNLDVSLDEMRREVKGCLSTGFEGPLLGTLRQLKMVLEYSTPQVRTLFKSAKEEAHTLRHNYVGTEHLLLALLLQRDGVAPVVLSRRGVKHDIVQAEVRKLLGP